MNVPDFYRSPCCRARLDNRGGYLHCRACDNAYPIHEGIPVLLPHEALRRCPTCNRLATRPTASEPCPNCGAE